jgi:hypothetical protein
LVSLFSKRKLQCQQFGELPRAGFPNRFGRAEVSMLLEKAKAQTRLSRDNPFGRLMRACYQAEERRLAAPVPAKNPPAVALSYGERYSTEDLRRAELDTGIRD